MYTFITLLKKNTKMNTGTTINTQTNMQHIHLDKDIYVKDNAPLINE